MCDYVVCVEVQELWLRNSGGLGYFTLCGFTYGFTQTALERQCGQCEGCRASRSLSHRRCGLGPDLSGL